MTISRKVGLHVLNSTGLALGRPAACKLVDPSLETYRRVRAEVGPDCLIVVRWYHAVQDLSAPAQNAWGWWQAHRDWIASVPGTDRTVYEGWNEIGDAQAPQYASFELARLQLLHSAGRRACVLNSSVGTPDLNIWPVYAPMLAHMQAGDCVGLHEYWSDRADIENVWHVRRFTIPSVAANLAGKKIVVTECGRDIVEGQGKPGWMLTCSADEYLGDLRRLGELYDGCPNVIGATVFQTGSGDPQWGPFNVWTLWPSVVGEYAAVSTPPVVPVPPTTRLVPPIDAANVVRVTQRFTPPSHYGIDYSCVVGTPIYAACDGVAYPGDQGTNGFGRYIRIEDGAGLYVYTAHLSVWRVGSGDAVKAGDLIGLSGNTGNSTGPHLHFEVRNGSRLQASAIDPEPMLEAEEEPEPTEPLPNDEQGPPAVLANKARWWCEEMQRQFEAGNLDRAQAIRLSLIDLLYRLENDLR